jgi:hypothetical protein
MCATLRFEGHGGPLKDRSNSGALAEVFVTLCEEWLAVVSVRSEKDAVVISTCSLSLFHSRNSLGGALVTGPLAWKIHTTWGSIT